MKSKLFSFSCLVMLFCFLSIQSISAQIAAPILYEDEIPKGPTTEITFDETEYDFGTVVSGEKVSQIFTFKNTGTEPLILINAKGSCGCTVPRWPKDPIAPGETASIEVSFNSKNKKGKRNQKVTITANTNPAQSFVYLKGEVITDENAEDAFEVVKTLDSSVEEIDIEGLDCVAIYPNPTADVLKLDLKQNIGQEVAVRIFSKNGQLMAEKQVLSIDGTIEFEVSHYPSGTYIAHVLVVGKKPLSHCFVVSGN